jgi:tRNA G46 methylase TrmB
MPILLDPEGLETNALFEQAGSFTGLRVLEVGCGDGRLTCRYAGQAASVVAIDPGVERSPWLAPICLRGCWDASSSWQPIWCNLLLSLKNRSIRPG